MGSLVAVQPLIWRGISVHSVSLTPHEEGTVSQPSAHTWAHLPFFQLFSQALGGIGRLLIDSTVMS